MTQLLLLLGLTNPDQYLQIFKAQGMRVIHSYPHDVNKETTGFYFCPDDDYGDSHSIYIWVKGIRTSLHFENGTLDHVLAPTNSMVRL